MTSARLMAIHGHPEGCPNIHIRVCVTDGAREYGADCCVTREQLANVERANTEIWHPIAVGIAEEAKGFLGAIIPQEAA
jgi:hypothetical protein